MARYQPPPSGVPGIITADGRFYAGATVGIALTAMRKDSWEPEPTAMAWRKKMAEQSARLFPGKVFRWGTARQFCGDQIRHGLMRWNHFSD
jgi:hypothetical protein